ncbi:TPA: hypothetical protein O3N06_002605 [Staphylococcus aureus]|nr:hypothetical protein [Staphylococcus aureus]HCY9658982.1 hypothetical protein [Staphylococcus aureus]HCZ5627086.1 hypothetical protein [Staphylococcus aureus]HEA6802703.1 hypothetical protein [Staphylococcus aureus]
MGKRAQHSEIGFPISTDDASWGNGPNIVKLDPQFLLTLQVGGPNIVKLDPQFLLTLQVGETGPT